MNSSFKFNNLQNLMKIKKDNDHLVKNLIQISNGRDLTVDPTKIAPSLESKNIPKSLNYYQRKKEQERIDLENQRMMKRIVKTKPTIKTKKIIHETKDLERVKDSMIKNVSSEVNEKLVRSVIKKHKELQ